jgi:hypothetical protein
MGPLAKIILTQNNGFVKDYGVTNNAKWITPPP